MRGQWQEPVRHDADRIPGQEVVAGAGLYHQGWSVRAARVTPLLQVTGAYRGHDGGPSGHPGDSGYTRLIVQPGLELDVSRVMVYAEVGFAAYNNMSGNQLVAKQLFKLNVSYAF